MNISALNQQFGIADTLRFHEAQNGLIVADIDNPLATAKICLQGAHLLSWHPRSTAAPVVWLSEDAQLSPWKSPHSGAPICWPWFGAHADNPAYPAHGYARNLPWEVVQTATETDGSIRLTLRLIPHDATRSQWPHAATLSLDVIVGDTLQLALTTTNSGDTPITISEAFHTYFQIRDVAQTHVTGLEGVTYADKVLDFARSTQQGAIAFDGEVDRVYVDTTDECVITDPVLQRRIHIAKSGSRSTVVWTPGKEKGDKLGDLGVEGWRHMVCVESANTMENTVVIAPGGIHTLGVNYRAAPL